MAEPTDDSQIKYPRLFYYEEGVGAFVPAPDDVATLIDVHCLDTEYEQTITFKRFDMTDEEYRNLPEG